MYSMTTKEEKIKDLQGRDIRKRSEYISVCSKRCIQ
jgi:hypothetical protein